MIKLETIGMFKYIKNDPTVVAHAEIPNGYVFTIDSDHETAAPTSSTAKTADLWFAMNEFTGDERYTNRTIKAGEKVNAILLKEFDHRNLIITADNLTTAFASIAVGDTMVADTYGKFVKETTLTGYAVYVTVLEKMQYGSKNAVRVQVSVVDKDTQPVVGG